jgi:uncharacterized protein YjbJ (UPF0337 family)
MAGAIAAAVTGARHAVHGLGLWSDGFWSLFAPAQLCERWRVRPESFLDAVYLDPFPPAAQPGGPADFGRVQPLRPEAPPARTAARAASTGSRSSGSISVTRIRHSHRPIRGVSVARAWSRRAGTPVSTAGRQAVSPHRVMSAGRWFRPQRAGHSRDTDPAGERTGVRSMSMFDKAKDKAEQFVGDAKERIGNKTDNEDLENAGKRDQLSGEAKETGHDMRDKAAGAMHDAKDRMQGN